jgi:hypothetical protein
LSSRDLSAPVSRADPQTPMANTDRFADGFPAGLLEDDVATLWMSHLRIDRLFLCMAVSHEWQRLSTQSTIFAVLDFSSLPRRTLLHVQDAVVLKCIALAAGGLTEINVSGLTKLTDAALMTLSFQPKLKVVKLKRCKLSELPFLSSTAGSWHPGVRVLHVNGTRLSYDAVRKLEAPGREMDIFGCLRCRRLRDSSMRTTCGICAEVACSDCMPNFDCSRCRTSMCHACLPRVTSNDAHGDDESISPPRKVGQIKRCSTCHISGSIGYFCPSCEDIEHTCAKCKRMVCSSCIEVSDCSACQSQLCANCKKNQYTCGVCQATVCLVCTPQVLGCDMYAKEDECHGLVCSSCAPSALTQCVQCKLWACQPCSAEHAHAICERCGGPNADRDGEHGCGFPECTIHRECIACGDSACSKCTVPCAGCSARICTGCRPPKPDYRLAASETLPERLTRACSWCEQLWCAECARVLKFCSECKRQACPRCNFECTLHMSNTCSCRLMPVSTRFVAGPCRRIAECTDCVRHMNIPPAKLCELREWDMCAIQMPFMHCRECVCLRTESRAASTHLRQYRLTSSAGWSSQGVAGEMNIRPPEG